MPTPTPATTKTFATPAKLRQWLKTHHAKRDELWVHLHKAHTDKPSVTWNDIVLETLCFGWIDGVKKSLGPDAYLQRITPRKPRSAWSQRNREHAERLIKEGRMQPAGLKQVEEAKKDGRWKNAYAPASEMKIPQDFLDAVAKHKKAQATLDACNKTNRYAIAYGLTTAKRPDTVQRRFDKFFNQLKKGDKPDFGFKKK